MSQVPSVEQSSTMTSSRSMFSGRGAVRTQRDAALYNGALVVDRHQDRELQEPILRTRRGLLPQGETILKIPAGDES